ncbi:MAG: VIT1/CCC1 transporter family protein [Guyparkeria sp.]|uniref:VIT1/CCC1 transporter family protein n=1 Tax=Guyparkeria sp. TaxID=2035736 RepID=UPI00397BA208
MEKTIDLHGEHHRLNRYRRLRASVLGAIAGLVAVSSLISGLVASGAPTTTVLVTGLIALVAGTLALAAGQHVALRLRQDTERADLEMEAHELEINFEHELAELRDIYVSRGVDPETAERVARQMMAHDALGAHAREEMGLHQITDTRPLLAAIPLGAAFAAGAALPLLVGLLAPAGSMALLTFVLTLLALAVLGSLSSRTGGASMLTGGFRTTLWGAATMGVTALVGRLIATVV